MSFEQRLQTSKLIPNLQNYIAIELAHMPQPTLELLASALNKAGFSAGKVEPKILSDEMRKVLIRKEFTTHEAAIDALLVSHGVTGSVPKLSYKEILKLLGMDARLVLACCGGSQVIIDHCCASYAESQSWSRWLAEFGFDRRALRRIIEAELKTRGLTGMSFLLTGNQATGAVADLNMGMIEAATLVAAVPGSTINQMLKPVIDGVLKQAGLTATIDELLEGIARGAQHEIDNKQLQAELVKAKQLAATPIVPMAARGPLPAGKYDFVPAVSVFKEMKDFDFNVPMWTWDAPHPDVPEKDTDYVFRKDMLLNVLLAIATGDMAWLVGHTGTGKTTLIEQVAARLNYPVARIAFDSAIDRNELVGRMELKGDGKGGTESHWKAGILEYAIPNGYIVINDEIDAARPDALYVMQPLFERKGLRLLEDGGRTVDFHPITRMFATGNTAGSGDPSGLYPACRILSAATLDRFPIFIETPYLNTAEEKKLIKSKAPGLTEDMLVKVSKFSGEMREAFIKGEIPISYSPRRSIAFARKVELLLSMTKGAKKPLSEVEAVSLSLRTKLYNAAPIEFRQRITEIARGVFGAVDPTRTL